MPDENTTEQTEDTQSTEQETAQTEASTEALQEQTEDTGDPQEQAPEQAQETSEDINIDEYSQERYQAPQARADGSGDIAQELEQLPTDDYGNVSTEAAAKWFSDKLSSVSSQAEERAVAKAQEVVMSNLSEVSQQRQLLDKYPELRKDRERLDAVFDIRDASALRGQNLSLSQAAERLNKLGAQSSKDAAKTTSIQAAAHLETASTKGDPGSGQDRLAAQAFQGSGNEAKQARRELLKQFVNKEISDGRIQHP